MDTQTKINNLLDKLHRNGQDTPKAILYAEGVKTKIRQARFSIKILREIVHLADESVGLSGATGPTTPDSLTISEQVNYHCDCFWDFLRSSLDILGQLINELRALGIGERDVDFKKVASKMQVVSAGSQLEKALSDLQNHCRAFKQLEDYRHCSTHRRHIYIETKTVTEAITGSPGYFAGTSTLGIVTERYLCTNPWDLKPKVSHGKRPVVNYCESLLKQIEQNINKIVCHLP